MGFFYMLLITMLLLPPSCSTVCVLFILLTMNRVGSDLDFDLIWHSCTELSLNSFLRLSGEREVFLSRWTKFEIWSTSVQEG